MTHIDLGISSYLNYIAQFKVLDKVEEKKIAIQAQAGDKNARNRLIISNLKFVVSIAKKYVNSGIPLIDIISEGNLGLMRAVENYDPNKDLRFITYAVWWIRQSILQAISEKAKPFKLPLSWNNGLAYLSKNNISENHLNDKKIFKKVSRDLKMNPKNIKHLFQLAKKPISLEDKVSQRGVNNSEVISTIENKNIVNPEKALLDSSIDSDLKEVLSNLSEIEQIVIIKRFGLFNSGSPKTLSEIGLERNLTKERIRQIEKLALTKIKKLVSKSTHLNYLIA